MIFKGNLGDKVIHKNIETVMTVMEINLDKEASVLCHWTDPTGTARHRWFERKELKLVVNK